MSGGWLDADKDVESPGVALGCAAGRFSFWGLGADWLVRVAIPGTPMVRRK
jgi:hypothetical protein